MDIEQHYSDTRKFVQWAFRKIRCTSI